MGKTPALERFMQYLKGKRVYLSGPIENSGGEDWGTPLKTFLAGLGVTVFDPATDPKQQWVSELTVMREACDYDGMHEICAKFVRKDLCLVDRSDFVIAYLPHKVPTTGTVHEIVVSTNSKKPTLLVCPQGKNKISLWYYGFISHRYMFGSWNHLFYYLEEVDRGSHKQDDRWAFVYNLI